jgi:hypothetical protein
VSDLVFGGGGGSFGVLISVITSHNPSSSIFSLNEALPSSTCDVWRFLFTTKREVERDRKGSVSIL